MSLVEIIKATSMLVKGAYTIAMIIRDSKTLSDELRQVANSITVDLTIVGGLLENLYNYAQRVTVHDEQFLIKNINILQGIVNDAKPILEKVQRDRNFIQLLFMNKGDYHRQLRDVSEHLHRSCVIIEGALPTLHKIQIDRKIFLDFRRIFYNMPEKSLSFYDFSITKYIPTSVLTINLEDFDTTNRLCYLKLGNDQFFFGYKLRTWSALDPKPIVLAQRIRDFRQRNLSSSASNRERLDFSELFMSHDDICGMAVTKKFIYIATKYEITVVSLSKQEIIAQHGIEGNGPKTFRHISYIYIPPKDEENLYIVDRGQYAVHHYKIDDSGLGFDYVRQYIVIADVNQQRNLISCTIYNKYLYVSDDGNNCLHVFPLNKERQSFYLTDNAITPFSPGSLYAHGRYLYVANCSAESPGILVFNEECQVVDWFHNQSLKEILAFDIDPNLNELYVLTTITTKTGAGNAEQRKEPSIVSMNSIIRAQN